MKIMKSLHSRFARRVIFLLRCIVTDKNNRRSLGVFGRAHSLQQKTDQEIEFRSNKVRKFIDSPRLKKMHI